MTYMDWISFTFGSGEGPSLCSSWIDWEPGELAGYCSRFFKEFDEVIEVIDVAKAKIALSIFPGIDGYLGVLSLPTLDVMKRENLAGDHFALFTSSFPERYPDEAFMWWERLAGASYGHGPVVAEDQKICDALLSVMSRLLATPSEAIQMSALHGIHEFTDACGAWRISTTRHFLDSSKAVNRRVAAYAQQVVNGTAM